MTRPIFTAQIPDSLIKAARTATIASSIVGIVLGIVALVWPGATLLVVALLFGFALIATGLFRLALAFSASAAPGSARVVYGILAALILVFGVICLFNPADALVFLGIFVGVGWIFDGVTSLMHLRSGYAHAPRWLMILGGAVSIVAGIVAIILPAFTVVVFLKVGALLLIVISIVTLLSLPKRVGTDNGPRRSFVD